jgi:hypothetical protein
MPNGVVTSYTYDNSDRVLSMTTRKASGIQVAGFNYTLDAVGNRLVLQEQDSTVFYKYDQAYRIKEETRIASSGALAYQDEYTYDKAGNRKTCKRTRKTGGGSSTAAYGSWPLDEVKGKSFTPPTAAFETDTDTVGLYHLEESESPMVDSSASANDGTIVDTVGTIAAGKFTETSCVRVPPASELTEPAVPGYIEAACTQLGAANWTLEAWVNPEENSGERTVLAYVDEENEPIVISI